MFNVTHNAIAVLRHVLDREGLSLRLTVVAGGCSGVQYGMSLESDIDNGDVVYIRDGVRIVVDASAARHLAGATIDFVEKPEGGGFVFDNPNFAGRCSCARTAAAAE